MITFDTSELDALAALLAHRGADMVPGAVAEAQQRANSNVASKTRERNTRNQFGQPRRGRISAAQVARWIERVMYRRLVDFFGNW